MVTMRLCKTKIFYEANTAVENKDFTCFLCCTKRQNVTKCQT